MANQVLRSLAAISWRGITDPSYWAGQGLLVWIHQRHGLRDVGSRLIDTHQTSATGLPSNNLLPRSAASNWWPHFSPKPFNCSPSLSLVLLHSSLCLPSLFCYTQKCASRKVCGWLISTFTTPLFDNSPLALLWWGRVFQFEELLLLEAGDRFWSLVLIQCRCVSKSLVKHRSQV